MAPAQVLGQFRHVRFNGPYLGEANHVEEIPAAEAGAVAGRQLSRQCRDNLLAVCGTFPTEHFLTDSGADLPVH